MRKKILIIGSSPDAISVKKWLKPPFDHIVVINNAWRIRSDWTNCIFPEDFPLQKKPKATKGQSLHSASEYVPAQNYFGGFVYAGGTMAFTAGYWALYNFKPDLIGYIGCDMIYEGSKTHFYGKGKADPLRKDKTLKNLSAKSARLEALARTQGCSIVNFSNLPSSNLVFPKQKFNDFNRGLKPVQRTINSEKIKMALAKEKALGYFIENGRYWEKMALFNPDEIKELDKIWLSTLY